ncbi:transketolase [Methylomonas sp. AM2-LC]|uniref:transketolase n=1 Tax=Methylomonas sp. AM2-LC TaxID=3153301 RepID=UPI00326791E4
MPEKLIKKMKRQIVHAAYLAGEGHVASAFSILDLLWVLYDKVMSFDATRPDEIYLDHFVLSKGHASLALYAVLAEKGILADDSLNNFCQYDGKLGGHPDCNKILGVEASTGSLGHGLPIAVGMALGSKISQFNNRIFCLIGDGECNEGTIWESSLLAAHHQLSNLCCIVDYNHSTDRALDLNDLAGKFKSFGWEVLSIPGHDHQEIFHALSHRHPHRPLAIIAETIKGYGIKSMENEPAWHHRSPNAEELNSMIKELS